MDLACGIGGNALFLAKEGLTVKAWDLSDLIVGKLNQHAKAESLALKASVVNVENDPPEPSSLDVLVVSHFLYRPHLKALEKALRPGGLLFYQTFTQERVAGTSGPKNPAFLLRPNELLNVFSSLRVLAYREDGLIGSLSEGVRNVAMLVAQRPQQ